MAKIIDLLHTEYTIAYIVRKYTRPSIYPKIVTSKPLSSFTEDEKKAILKKYKRWYVYYSFEHPTAKTTTGQPKKVPQTPIYFNVNQDYKDFDERLKFLKMVRNSIEKLLKDGFSPYETGETASEHTALSALDFALEIKRPEVKGTTFSGYETKINLFKKYIKSQGYSHLSIKDINKSIVTQYLRTIKNPTNRNNTKGALSAIFTVLSSEDLIPVNFIKEIQNSKKEEKPVRIYTEEDVTEISTLLKQHDQTLLMFIKFVSFMFWRPIEILRIRLEDINFERNTISVETKTKSSKTKIIPKLLIDELAEFAKGKTGFLFKPDKIENWDLSEEDKRKYFTRRFSRFREKYNISKDFKLYSFRHTYITKIYLELRKTLSKHETIQQLSLITGHESKAIFNYIRVNDVELPEDYSSFLE
ncbi:tyrosine-type recombinase/integrase [Labilibaculum sp. K2S]|nr:tyrosine-type recombinase/integrase [Labilibaculum sp. K2S]